MLATEQMMWQHTPAVHMAEHTRRDDLLPEWDLSELFQGASTLPAFMQHPRHQQQQQQQAQQHHHQQQQPPHHGQQQQQQASHPQYAQQEYETRRSVLPSAHYTPAPPNGGVDSTVAGYDNLYQSSASASGTASNNFTTARPTFQHSESTSSSSSELSFYQSSAFSASPSPATPFELMTSLGSVPEDPLAVRQSSPRTGSAGSSHYSPYTPASGTISPNVIASSGEQHFAREPSFAELMMDQPSPYSRGSEPGSGVSASHTPHHLQPSSQDLQYAFVSDPSSSTSRASSSMPAQQFESHGSYGANEYNRLRDVFDHATPSYSNDISRSTSMQASTNRPHLDEWMRADNRLAAGEQTVIVMSSRVAQKSYGNEKRFLCPPPTAVLLGPSWWADANGPDGVKPSAAHVTIAISGESTASEGTLEWTTPAGKPIDLSEEYADTSARIGRCVGKQLFISDVDERKKRVEALVKVNITALNEDGGLSEHVVGTFPSRPIKVISKPSKKRQSAKNLELCINHGSTVSLFHRLRSQTVSTKYLCVSGSGASFKGSDGGALPGLDSRQRSAAPSFVAKTASWDMFIIYIVDVNKPSSGPDAIAPSPMNPDYPPPPPNAISVNNDGGSTPIFYNQTVVLQCLTSGVVSPVLVIRKVDHATVVVGGGLTENAKGVPDHHCIPGEVCGDPVSQLHKIAFEVYEPGLGATEAGGPGLSGAFLSCMGEKVNTYRPVDVRQWNGVVSSPSSFSGSPLPGNSTLNSKGGSPDPPFYPPSHVQTALPDAFDFMAASADGGRVRRKRGMSGSSGGTVSASVSKGPAKGRRRMNSTSSSTSRNSNEQTTVSGALWSIDIGETAVWTIVGTDQVRYNFFVPATMHGGRSLHIPTKPVAPVPTVLSYSSTESAGAITLHGENFSKHDPPAVFFGTEESGGVEVRSSELIICRPPTSASSPSSAADQLLGVVPRRHIVLVRGDGVVYPSDVLYP